jgi:hypothetical protein
LAGNFIGTTDEGGMGVTEEETQDFWVK